MDRDIYFRKFCLAAAAFLGFFLAPLAHGDPYPSVDLRVPGLPPTQLYTNPDDSTIRAVLERDQVWEDLETRWILHTIRRGDVFVDVGANIGYYTVIASKIVGDEGHVYAFEPDPTSFAILKANVERNGLTNVTLEQKALSNEPGSLRLFLAHENKGDHRIFDEEGAARPFLDVEALPLDDYAPIQGKKVDFIKVDTQGAEGIILEGMTQTIAANPKMVMVMEYTPSSLRAVGTDPADFLSKLQEMDFRFFNLGMGFGAVVPQALRADALHTSGDQFANLYMLPGLSRLQEMDARVFLAAEALGKAAAEADSASWESSQLAALQANPWQAPEMSGQAIGGGVEIPSNNGCLELSEAGPHMITLANVAAEAKGLRLRSRSVGAASGVVAINAIAAFPAEGSKGENLSKTPLFRPREPAVALFPGSADMRLRSGSPDIVQMALPPETMAEGGYALELLVDWPENVPGRFCALISMMSRPLNFDAEVALRTAVADRDSRLSEVALIEFRDRSPQFASLRQSLQKAEQERRAFETLSPGAIQGWIRVPDEG
jgi:FkbM family methyltransferase